MRRAVQVVLGEPVALDGIPLAGMLDRQIARLALERHGVDEERIARLLPAIMEWTGYFYEQLVRPGARRDWVLPGVRALLSRLRRRGHVTGVLTGNTERVARAKLAAAELADLLPFGAYGDQADERHELVECARSVLRVRYALDAPLTRIVLVGDTPRDVAAALESGTKILAVATGRFGPAELVAAGAHAVVTDLSESDTVVAKLEELMVME